MRSTVLLVFVLVALLWSASPQAARFGAFFSHQAETRFDLPLDVDLNGRPRAPKELVEVRQHVAVPDFYGKLVSVSQSGEHAIAWYQDGAGTLRNVVLDSAASVPYAVEQRAAGRVAVRVIR